MRLLLATLILPMAAIAKDYDRYDDWMDCATNDCSKSVKLLCKGYYLEPKFPLPTDSDHEKYPTRIVSDSSKLVTEGKSEFNGDVIVTRGNQKLTSEQVQAFRNKDGDLEKLYALGDVSVIEPGMRIDGTRAEVFSADDKKIMYDSHYRIYSNHLHGDAGIMTTEKQVMHLQQAKYTSCAPRSNAWLLSAKQVKLDRESGRGEAWNAKFYLKRMPIFFTPYVSFPIDNRRYTGFLQPSLSSSSNQGRSISLPFYWNLAENYDATITSSFMSKRGFKLDNNFRYLTKTSSGNITLNYAFHDHGYRDFRDRSLLENKYASNNPRILGLRDTHHRYRFVVNHRQQINKNFSYNINFQKFGDANYQFDFPLDSAVKYVPQSNAVGAFAAPSTIVTSNSILQQGTLTYGNQYASGSFKLERYHILHPYSGATGTETYRKLPEITLNSTTYDLPYSGNFNAYAGYTQFQFPNSLEYVTPHTTGRRIYLIPQATKTFGTPGWYISPKVKLRMVNYSLNLSSNDVTNNKPRAPGQIIPSYSINSGLVLERELKLQEQDFVQTLEPRLMFLYTPNRNQSHLPNFDSGQIGIDYSNLFTDNRYSGYDRVSEAYQISMGVSSIFFPEANGQEQAKIAVGRILYLQDRQAKLNENIDNSTRWSDIAATASYKINPKVEFSANLVRSDIHTTKSGSLNVQYRPENKYNIANLGYQFARNDTYNARAKRNSHIRQTHISGAYQVGPQLNLLGALNYDLNYRKATRIFTGFELHTCCTVFRLIWRRVLNSAPSINERVHSSMLKAQLVFKGFSDVGTMETNHIKSEIPGYVPEDNYFQ